MKEIDPRLLPVPLEYTYPIIMECYMYRNNKDKSKGVEKKFYFPETGSWLNRKKRVLEYLKIRGLSYTQWSCRWYLHLPEEKIGTEEWADRMIEVFYSDKLEDTQRVIKEELLKDHDYVCDFLMTSKDFINLYYKTRKENNIPILKYDFSKLPERIQNTNTRLEIPLLEINPKTGKPRGEYYTNFGYFIKMQRDASVISEIKSIDSLKKKFIEQSKQVHGDKYGYDSVDYTDSRTPVKIFCKKCQEYFWQAPISHTQGHGCPTCANIKETRFDWEKEINNILNMIIVERKNLSTIGEAYGVSGHQIGVILQKLEDRGVQEVISEEEKEEIDQYLKNGKSIIDIASDRGTTLQEVYYKLKRLGIDYNIFSSLYKSFGETCIEEFLKTYKIEYKEQVTYSGIEGRNSDYIIVDFWVKYKDREYVIEYNGKQHYEYVEYFHKDQEKFDKQVKRDQNERKYFSRNDILETLIEIPYTISSKTEIWRVLEDTIVHNMSYEVNYTELYKTN